MLSKNFSSLLVLTAVSLLFCGCGDSRREPAKGVVTVDGTPLEKGYIMLHPMSGTEGPNAGADIIDGAYEIASSKGVFEGKFKVEIKGWRDSGKKMEDTVTGEVFSDPEQFLPAKFNKHSELTVEIKSGTESYDFPLEL